MSISTKWPAARLVGPSVTQEQALDFIRRTDSAFSRYISTNDRRFEADLRTLMGFAPDDRTGHLDFRKEYAYEEAFREAFGSIYLEHLASHWVASCWIGGPHGPVSPSGKVYIYQNFGKWPNTDELEADLTKIAEAFPWLTFDLSVWGHSEEEADGPPSITWHLEGGKWEVVEPKILNIEEADIIGEFMRGINDPMQEKTWTIDQIESMWGEQIAAARKAAKAKIQLET